MILKILKKVMGFIPRKWLRLLEMFMVVLFCATLAFSFFHYFYNIPYSKVLGIALAWFIYQAVKFISIRNKKLFILNY